MEKGTISNTKSVFDDATPQGMPELVGQSFAVGGQTRFQNMSGFPKSKFGLYNIAILDEGFDTVHENYYAAQEMIKLCRAAYRHVPIFKNGIDILSTLANTPVHLKGGTKQSVQFFEGWLNRIGIYDLKSQFFKEACLTGNVFYYRTDAEMSAAEVIKLNKSYAKLGGSVAIPTKYIMLDAANVCVLAIAYDLPAYYKILNRLELEQLKHSEDFNDQLSYKEIKTAIDSYTVGNGQALIKLNPADLHAIFLDKQDYEPMAIPLGFPVLNDVDLLMAMKTSDGIISKAVEYVLLLITTGAKKDEGGVNPLVIESLKNMFKNQRVERVLVSDYTTSAEFITPDLTKILTPEKYNEVNRAISDGLMNVFAGEQKFAQSVNKLRILVKRIEHIQNLFVNQFLNKEIKRIAGLMGFKNYPTATLEPPRVEDQTNAQRVYTQLINMGILSAKDGLELFETGLFPNYEELVENQQEFKSNKDKGLFQPTQGGPFAQLQLAKLAGQQKAAQVSQKGMQLPGGGRPSGTKAPQTTKKVSQVGAESMAEDYKFSQRQIVDNSIKLGKIRANLKDIYKKTNNLKRVSDNHLNTINSIASLLLENEKPDDWAAKSEDYIKDISKFPINASASMEIEKIKHTFGVSADEAVVLYHSQIVD